MSPSVTATVLASAPETKLFSLLVPPPPPDWRWHLLFVRPETVRHPFNRGGDPV